MKLNSSVSRVNCAVVVVRIMVDVSHLMMKGNTHIIIASEARTAGQILLHGWLGG